MTDGANTQISGADGKPERISEAEYAVMEALWTRSPLTAADVCEAVCQQRDWSLATVKTLLSRLVTKQAIATEPDGRRFLYSPVLARTDYLGGEIPSFGRPPVWWPRRAIVRASC